MLEATSRSVPSVSFVEINHQLSWLHPGRHAVRLMLPQSTPDPAVAEAHLFDVRRSGKTDVAIEVGWAFIPDAAFPIPKEAFVGGEYPGGTFSWTPGDKVAKIASVHVAAGAAPSSRERAAIAPAMAVPC